MNFKREISWILVLALVISLAVPRAVRAADLGADDIEGYIQVLSSEQNGIGKYRARWYEEYGEVYIGAHVFANMMHTKLKTGYHHVTLSKGTRVVEIDSDSGLANVYYDMNSDMPVLLIYNKLNVGTVVYDEDADEFYLPLEKLLYMFSCEWGCVKGVVCIYQPENLLDIIADSPMMVSENPNMTDYFGDSISEQMGNAFKYGVLAGLDEIDMTFIKDSILTSLFIKDHMTYEENAMDHVLLGLSQEMPDNVIADDYATVDKEIATMSNYIDTFNKLGSIGDDFKPIEELIKDISILPLDGIHGDMWGSGMSALPYLLGVGETLWIREYIPESFGRKLLYLRDMKSENREDKSEYKFYNKRAGSVYKTYYGSVLNAWTKDVTVDDVFSMIDDLIKLTGDASVVNAAVEKYAWPLRMMSLTVDIIDFSVEMIKSIHPNIQKAFEDADDAFECLYAIQLSNHMSRRYKDSVRKLYKESQKFNLKDCTEMRVTAQLMEGTALYAHEKLVSMGKILKDSTYYVEADYLSKLNNSEKYDGLLFMQSEFIDIHQSPFGYRRDMIPKEYIFPDEGNQVIVEVDAEKTVSEVMEISIARPYVSIPSKPEVEYEINNSEAMLQAYDQAAETANRMKADEESLQGSRFATGSSFYRLKLVDAHATSGALSLQFMEHIYASGAAHPQSIKYTLNFSLDTGEKIAVEDVLDTENNPQAMEELCTLLADDLYQQYPDTDVYGGFSQEKAYQVVCDYLNDYDDAIWGFSGDGLVMTFSPYFIGPYGMGYTDVTAPFSQLPGIIKEEYVPEENTEVVSDSELEIVEADQAANYSTIYGTPGQYAIDVHGATDFIIGEGVNEVNNKARQSVLFYASVMDDGMLYWLPDTEEDKLVVEYDQRSPEDDTLMHKVYYVERSGSDYIQERIELTQ